MTINQSQSYSIDSRAIIDACDSQIRAIDSRDDYANDIAIAQSIIAIAHDSSYSSRDAIEIARIFIRAQFIDDAIDEIIENAYCAMMNYLIDIYFDRKFALIDMRELFIISIIESIAIVHIDAFDDDESCDCEICN